MANRRLTRPAMAITDRSWVGRFIRPTFPNFVVVTRSLPTMYISNSVESGSVKRNLSNTAAKSVRILLRDRILRTSSVTLIGAAVSASRGFSLISRFHLSGLLANLSVRKPLALGLALVFVMASTPGAIAKPVIEDAIHASDRIGVRVRDGALLGFALFSKQPMGAKSAQEPDIQRFPTKAELESKVEVLELSPGES